MKRISQSKIKKCLNEKYKLMAGERSLENLCNVFRVNQTFKLKVSGRSLVDGRKRVVWLDAKKIEGDA